MGQLGCWTFGLARRFVALGRLLFGWRLPSGALLGPRFVAVVDGSGVRTQTVVNLVRQVHSFKDSSLDFRPHLIFS